jgi:hypothetical protein
LSVILSANVGAKTIDVLFDRPTCTGRWLAMSHETATSSPASLRSAPLTTSTGLQTIRKQPRQAAHLPPAGQRTFVMGNPNPDERSDEERGERPGSRDRGEGDHAGDRPGAVPEILRGKSPRQVLERLLQGDPLELAARCRESLEGSARLLDPSRLHLRALARVAHAALHYTGDPPLADWLERRIEQSIQELLAEDREEVRQGLPLPTPSDPRYAFVSEVLGLEPAQALHACVAFNALAHEVRCVWFALTIGGMTVNRYVAEGHGPPGRVKAHLKLALRTIAEATGRRRSKEEGGGNDEL